MNQTTTHRSRKCPGCGKPASILRDPLGLQLRCTACGKRFRIHDGGQVVEIGARPGKAAVPESRPPQRRLRWTALAASWALFLGILGWSLWPQGRARFDLAPLPEDLNARAELMGKAWLEGDLVTMRRLTADRQGRALRSWLQSHPAPKASPFQDSRCEVVVLKQKPTSVQLAIRVTPPDGARSELQQTWVKGGDGWVFLPEEGRKHAVRQSRP